jgi:hypothetical protein
MTSAIAVLVEICFLDAAEDTKTLDRVGIETIAQSIYNGLTHGSTTDPQPDNHANDPVVKPQERSILLDAAKWYKGLPHQDEAWRALEKKLDPITIMDFRSGYTPDSVPIKPVANTPTTTITTPAPKPAKPSMSVGEWIARGDGSTNGVKGLSDQIIRQMGDVGLVKFTHPQFIAAATCDPYFHPEAARKLRTALDANPHLQMRCNSAYRSPVRQLVLRRFFEMGIHGITAAARVGTGNHERGLAIDLDNWIQWKPILIANGWHWQGSGDPMHFDLDIDSDVPHRAIKAFQELANQYQKADLVVDGIWGEQTKQAMLNAPANGW